MILKLVSISFICIKVDKEGKVNVEIISIIATLFFYNDRLYEEYENSINPSI